MSSFAVLSGCGGGSAPGSSVVGGGTVSAGTFSLEGQVNEPQVLSAEGGAGSVYGITGNITLATMRDPIPTAEEGEIVFYEYGLNGHAIMAISPDKSDLRQICTPVNMVQNMAVDPSGTNVYFTANGILFRASLRGSAPTQVLADVHSFAFTPSGSVIVGRRSSSNELFRCSSTGTNVLSLTTPVASHAIIACPTESYAVTQSGSDLFRLPLVAGNPPQSQSTLSPDLTTFYNAAERALYVRIGDGPDTDYGRVYPTVASAWGSEFFIDNMQVGPYELTFSPDGRKIAGITYPGFSARLATLNAGMQPVDTLHQSSSIDHPVWAPSQTVRTFVGAGTTFPSGVGAMLFAENDTTVPAVVFADAVTRASMTLTPVSQAGDANVIYRIQGDNLNKLYYTKGNGYTHVGVVTTTSGLKGALISFSASTGRVTNVVTFTNKPTVNRTAAGYEISGDGIEAFDGSGNRRPSTDKIVIPR